MKTITLLTLSILLLNGCAPSDPIDRVVQEASSNPNFSSDGWMAVLMIRTSSPVTMFPEELTKWMFKDYILESWNTNRILEVKKVQISYELANPNGAQSSGTNYLAVLVNTDMGRRVILYKDSGKSTKYWIGWEFKIDDKNGQPSPKGSN